MSTNDEMVWDEWLALQELPDYDDQSGGLLANRNKGFWGLFRRLFEKLRSPDYLEEENYKLFW